MVEVLRALQEIPQPLPSREALVEWLQSRGFSGIPAQWMTTNLRRDDGGFWWRRFWRARNDRPLCRRGLPGRPRRWPPMVALNRELGGQRGLMRRCQAATHGCR